MHHYSTDYKIPNQQYSPNDYYDENMYDQGLPDSSDNLVYKQTPNKRMGM